MGCFSSGSDRKECGNCENLEKKISKEELNWSSYKKRQGKRAGRMKTNLNQHNQNSKASLGRGCMGYHYKNSNCRNLRPGSAYKTNPTVTQADVKKFPSNRKGDHTELFFFSFEKVYHIRSLVYLREEGTWCIYSHRFVEARAKYMEK